MASHRDGYVPGLGGSIESTALGGVAANKVSTENKSAGIGQCSCVTPVNPNADIFPNTDLKPQQSTPCTPEFASVKSQNVTRNAAVFSETVQTAAGGSTAST